MKSQTSTTMVLRTMNDALARKDQRGQGRYESSLSARPVSVCVHRRPIQLRERLMRMAIRRYEEHSALA
jgi:hypothetical protein